MQNRIYYFDNAATTSLDPEVLNAMMPFLKDEYGNASSIYSLGQESRKAIDEARDKVAKVLGCDSSEIYFTGSGTESDNWALKGVALQNQQKGKHIITSSIEHHAVLHTCEYLARKGFEITYLPVAKNGIVQVEDLEKAIREDTMLISIMLANNEIGTIQPIQEIAKIANRCGILFHTDAVQAIGSIPVNVKDLGVDLLSLTAHKFYGPKGVGALYIKKGTEIENLMEGGGQEKAKRPSTENVAGIVGLGRAIEIAKQKLESNMLEITKLRDYTIQEIIEKIPDVQVNGDLEKRLPGNVNISFKYVEGESILLMLDALGICASSGSACTSGSLEPSHVLRALKIPHAIAHGSIRFSLGKSNKKEEVDYLVESLLKIIEKLRAISPLYKK
jgi:cysteine desulfurase